MATGTLQKVGDSVTFTGTPGQAGNFTGLYGTFAGLTVGFSSSLDGVSFSPASGKSQTGGGAHSQWSPPSNTPNMWLFDDLPSGSSLRVTCLAITSGSASVYVGAKPPGGGQVSVTYSASMTPDPNQGTFCTIVVTNGSAMTINAPTSQILGQEITFEISNTSGGSMGAITWDATYKLAGAFNNPANNKKRTISFKWDGNNWIETARAAADI